MGHGRMDRIAIDLDRPIGAIDRNVFGGFVEHLGRCVYGGIFEPGSPRSGPDGLRADVLEASRRLRYANIRYPGGNFVSAYRWRDGVGPVEERPGTLRARPGTRSSPTPSAPTSSSASVGSSGAEPYLVVNCRRWRHARGARLGGVLQRHQADRAGQAARSAWLPRAAPRALLGHRQRGRRTHGRSATRRRTEYARTYTEYAKVMRWADPEHQAAGLRRVVLGGPAARAHRAAAGAGSRAHRLPRHPLVRGRPGRGRACLPGHLRAHRGAPRASSRGSPWRRRCTAPRGLPSPSPSTSGTSGTRPRATRATRTSTSSRRRTTSPMRSWWPCTSTPSSATPAASAWPTSRSSSTSSRR